MKRNPLIPAVVVGLVCLALVLWPSGNPLYFTAAYAGLSACSLVTFVWAEKPWRWLAIFSLLFGLTGVYVAWHSHSAGRPVINPNQMRLAGAPVWIQWSSTRGGNE